MKWYQYIINYKHYQVLSILIFIFLSVPITLFSVKQPGWIKATIPYQSYMGMYSILGYSQIIDNHLVFYETVPSYQMVWNFNGANFPSSFYHMRAIYPYIVSLISPFAGIDFSFLLVNYFAWAISAYLAWRFTLSIFKDALAGLIAVILTCGGMGWITVLGTFDSHLFSIFIFYLGVVIIFETKVWQETKPFRSHLILGLFLAIAALVYNTGLLLLAGYLILSWRKNNWIWLIMVILITLSSTIIWRLFLPPFYDAERTALIQSLRMWENQFHKPILELSEIILSRFFTFVSIDSPLVVSGGLLSIIWIIFTKKDLRRFFLTFLILPLLLLMPYKFIHDVAINNYIVYGITIILFAALSGLLAFLIRQSKINKILSISITVIILIPHLIWSTSHFWGYLGPTFAYYYSYQHVGNLFRTIAQFENLTSDGSIPYIVGGSSSLVASGLVHSNNPLTVNVSFIKSIEMHAIISTYILFLILSSVNKKRSIYVSGIFLSTIIAFVLVGSIIPQPQHTYWDNFFTGRVYPNRTIKYTINISKNITKQLILDSPKSNKKLYLFLGATVDPPGKQDQLFIEMFAGNDKIVLHNESFIQDAPQGCSIWSTDLTNLVQAIEKSPTITVIMKSTATIRLRGWQSAALPGRIINQNLPFLPSFELRLIDQSGSLILLEY